ncbi:hypothetical protein [Aestuariispira insulae]|uniref:Uncharacterized protein n=1 Tax=Aestuariispira insulae TaxID=1461337 RepID=A0A3D9HV16_9PROT|nr:hypothetical protein [Aestuariispira insulae]RED53332.1 hypothetical protein DFP90_101118 [Aestuariispira insulae]
MVYVTTADDPLYGPKFKSILNGSSIEKPQFSALFHSFFYLSMIDKGPKQETDPKIGVCSKDNYKAFDFNAL